MYHIQYALPFRLRENSFAATRRRFSQTAETLVVVKRQLSMAIIKLPGENVNLKPEKVLLRVAE